MKDIYHAVYKGGARKNIMADSGEAAWESAKLFGDVESVAALPYPFCHKPEKCAGRGSCQSEIVCND